MWTICGWWWKQVMHTTLLVGRCWSMTTARDIEHQASWNQHVGLAVTCLTWSNFLTRETETGLTWHEKLVYTGLKAPYWQEWHRRRIVRFFCLLYAALKQVYPDVPLGKNVEALLANSCRRRLPFSIHSNHHVGRCQWDEWHNSIQNDQNQQNNGIIHFIQLYLKTYAITLQCPISFDEIVIFIQIKHWK